MKNLRAGLLMTLAGVLGCGEGPSPASRLAPAVGKSTFAAGPTAARSAPSGRSLWPPATGAAARRLPSFLPEARGASLQQTTRRIRAPEFPRDSIWLNTGGPIRMRDLRGKFVLLDFWTYCCINCFHVLPELKKLERAYASELVVVGVHSAKFATERDAKNIEEAILRYDIEHPVVNDASHRIWSAYGVRVWPTLVLIDPQGYVVWRHSGEILFEQLDSVLKPAVPAYRRQGLLDLSPVRFDLAARRQEPTALRFPGKVLADEASNRLFVADSNHNRIVIATLDGRRLETVGSGGVGRADGDFATATFHHPQGMALRGDSLYVADTENHLLRKIDLRGKRVSTIAGTGAQARPLQSGPSSRFSDGRPRSTPLASPWALWIHGEKLYIAMAGAHQIWRMPLDLSEIGPYAGNGAEDVVDGSLLPRRPFQPGFCSLAQPSGLAADAQWLYVADSEGSSIRAVPFDPTGKVRTVVGTAGASGARLFTFGDRDGRRSEVLLQHPLGIAYHDGQLYVADTYNNKVKVVDPDTGQTRTLAAGVTAAPSDAGPSLNEPSGVSVARGQLYVADTNNHRIVLIDPSTGQARVLTISGLQPPPPAAASTSSGLQLDRAPAIRVSPTALRPVDGRVKLSIELALPPGWKINPQAPMRIQLEAASERGPLDRAALGVKEVDEPSRAFEIDIPVRGEGEERLKVSLAYYICQVGGEGICRAGGVVWAAPLRVIASRAGADRLRLQHVIRAAGP